VKLARILLVVGLVLAAAGCTPSSKQSIRDSRLFREISQSDRAEGCPVIEWIKQ